MRPALLAALLCVLLGSVGAQAQSTPEASDPAVIAAANGALTGTFAVLRGVANGSVEAPSDALRVFGVGVAGGVGFYQAKRWIGEGREWRGVALAYGAASVVENAARGHHSLSHVRAGIGPLDVRLRTPLAEGEAAPTTVQLNAVGAAGLAVMPLLGYRPVFRHGTLSYESTEGPLLGNERRGGLAIARVFIVRDVASDSQQAAAYDHELIHFVQALQVGATTPYHTLSDLRGGPLRLGPLRVDVQFDWLYGALAAPLLALDYEHRPWETEAFTLVEEPLLETEPAFSTE